MSSNRKSSRREFLRGQAIARELQAGLSNPAFSATEGAHSLEQSRRRQAGYLQQYLKTAMACEFELLFNMDQYPRSGDAALQVFELIDRLESQLTIYRDDSEVSHLNCRAASEPTAISETLRGLLQLSIEINLQTAGAFDVTAGPLSELWGFQQRAGSMPSPGEIDETLSSVGSHLLKLGSEPATIQYLSPALKLNFGGIGKGFALDRAAELMAGLGIGDFVIHGGQSSVKAAGSQLATLSSETEEEATSQPSAWVVGLSHPTIPEQRLAEIYLTDEALGTSGTARQGFFHQGRRYGHIINPRTGWPTEHILSTTVITDSAARADALATAFFVMELPEIAEFCSDHSDVSAILVLPGARSGQVRIESHNMREDRWKILDQ